MKINTDPKKIDEVLSRGVVEVIQQDELRKKMLSGEKLRVKLGIDPTSQNIHLGRSVPLLKLRDFQELGHQVVFIVGDFTGVIGDTSDKESERPMLSEEKVDENKKHYFEQVAQILDIEKAEFRNNSEWLKPLNYADIGKQADAFSVADFIARDNIRRRLQAGTRVSLREMLYPLMQGYDSVAVKADVEIGGTDQRFNLLAGRHMQPHYNQKSQNIVIGPLIEGLDGRKMSSSWSNTINIKDTPSDMYGKIMSMSDNLMFTYFNVFTRLSLGKIEEYKKHLEEGTNPIEIKHKLSQEIVRMYHGEQLAKEASSGWKKTFSNQGVPDDIVTTSADNKDTLSEVLIKAGVVSSKTEFRRLLEAGAIKKYSEEGFVTIQEDSLLTESISVKIGKKRFLKIEIN